MSNGGHIRLEELELYAVGALPAEEAEPLNVHVAGCAECSKRLAEARGNAALLAFAASEERPAGTVKAELMARIRASRESEERYAWPLDEKQAERGTRPAKKVEPIQTSNWLNWVLVTAAVALALMSYALSGQNRRLAEQLKKQEQQARVYMQEREQTEKLLIVLGAPDTRTVKLGGTSEAASASGVVKYNGRMGAVVYSANLPPLPAGKVYQMWLVPTNGAPIDAGIFGAEEGGSGRLMSAEVPANTEAHVFAVTIEPAGGAAQPTGPKVLVGTN